CFEPRRTLSSHVCADRPDSGLDPSYSSPCPRFSVVGFSCRLEAKPVCVLVRKSAAILLLLFPMSSWAQRSYAAPPPPDQVESEKFAAEVTSFLGKELAAHVADIHALDPPQERVEGALTTGEFSWGTFLRALASYSDLSGERSLAGRDLPQLIGKA